MNKTETLIRKLRVLNDMKLNQIDVVSKRWDTVMKIVKSLNDKKTRAYVLEKEWYDRYKRERPDMYPLDLLDIHKWSTFDNTECINLEFGMEDDGKLHCHAIIYDGDMMNGYKEVQRFTADIILPYTFVLKITGIIESAFDVFLNWEYEANLEVKRTIWKRELERTLLL